VHDATERSDKLRRLAGNAIVRCLLLWFTWWLLPSRLLFSVVAAAVFVVVVVVLASVVVEKAAAALFAVAVAAELEAAAAVHGTAVHCFCIPVCWMLLCFGSGGERAREKTTTTTWGGGGDSSQFLLEPLLARSTLSLLSFFVVPLVKTRRTNALFLSSSS
jgi:hypothetical protein